MKKFGKLLALTLATTLGVSLLSGCQKSSTAETSKTKNFSIYMYGSAGAANKTILDEINKKLKKDLNETLTIKYIDWNDVSTKYPLLFAAGQQFDMVYSSSTASPAYSTLATQGSFEDISKYLDSTPTLKSTISEASWNQMKINGGIYAVPSNYTEYTPTGFVSNASLQKKYNISSINSISTMEAYMDAVVKNEKYSPLNGSSVLSESLYRMFTATTGSWIKAPGISDSDIYLAGASASNYKDVFSPVFTQQYEDWAVLMKKWADKGYWPKDIMSSQKGDKDNFDSGLSGGYIDHMSDWTGNYGTLKALQPNATTNFWCFAESAGKIMKTPGVQNATAISKNCTDPAGALKIIEKLMTDKSYYDLFQYGILNKQYDVKNNQLVVPTSYNKDTDAFGFSGWAFRNDKFNIPSSTEDPRRYELIKKWNTTSIADPYAGFSFDDSSVSSQISAITNVNATMGVQIMLGKSASDAKTAVAQYRTALKSAGIDTVISEVKKQLASYTKAS